MPIRPDALSERIASPKSAAMLTGDGDCFSEVTYPNS